jgi:serine/threonine protein kinase
VKAYKKSNVKGASLVYAAPEILSAYGEDGGEDVSKPADEAMAGDVYSYSMIIYELLCRRIPWWDVDDLDEIVRLVVSGSRPKIPKALTGRRQNDPYIGTIMTIMEACWNNSPMGRPKMMNVLTEIDGLLSGSSNAKKI